MAAINNTRILKGKILGDYSREPLSQKVIGQIGSLTITTPNELNKELIGQCARIAIDLLRKEIGDSGDGDLNLSNRYAPLRAAKIECTFINHSKTITFRFPPAKK